MKALMSLAVVLVVASQAIAGMTITYAIRGDGRKSGSEKPTTMRMKIDGNSAKMEWIEGDSRQAAGKTGYMVTKDGGKTLYMVNPEDKSYVDMAAMAQLAAGSFNMKVKEYKTEKLLDEAGPTMLGYPTRHCKFTTSFTMEMAIFGMKRSHSGKSEQEMWITPKVDVGETSIFEKIGAQAVGGMAELQKIMDAERAKVAKGLALKVITTGDSGSPGKPNETKTTMEVTEIKEGGIPASEFEIPKDYKESKMEGMDRQPESVGSNKGEDDGGDAGGDGEPPSRKPATKAPPAPPTADSLIRRFGPRR